MFLILLVDKAIVPHSRQLDQQSPFCGTTKKVKLLTHFSRFSPQLPHFCT
jgi:hypothetical protein